MTDHYIDERKRYVAEVKKSFETGYGVNTYEDDYSGSIEQSSSFSLFRFRFMIAVFLFCVYLYCDYTETPIYHYTTEDVVTVISENEFYQKLENYVMIQMMQD
ncbi:MAG: hypothetical protein ACI4ES_02770 [Roseburia sp.]